MDDRFPGIIQLNNDNVVLLGIEQSLYPGEENSNSRAEDLPPQPRPPGLPWLRRREREIWASSSAAATSVPAAGRQVTFREPVRGQTPSRPEKGYSRLALGHRQHLVCEESHKSP
jgi:hypothetical protein